MKQVRVPLQIDRIRVEKKKDLQVFLCFAFFTTLTTFFMLLQQLSSIKISREVALLSTFLALLAGFRIQTGWCIQDTQDRIITALFAIATLITTFRIPNYSYITIFIFICLFIYASYYLYGKGSSYIYGLIIALVATIYVFLIILNDEGKISISWSWLHMPAILLIILWFTIALNDFANCYKQIRNGHLLYYFTMKGFIIDQILQHFTLPSFLSLLLKTYLDSQHFLWPIQVVFTGNLIFMIIYLYYFQEVYVIVAHSTHKKDQAFFRIHQRTFSQSYSSTSCDRVASWSDEPCLLCPSRAVIVYFTCGHLTLCRDCHIKKRRKGVRPCQICKENTVRFKQIQFADKNVVFGYQRKVFIEKKLRRNQYRIKQ